MKCDWCGGMQETVPVVLGYSKTGAIADVNLCERALATIRRKLAQTGTTSLYRYGHPGNTDSHFLFDMIAAWE